MIFSVSVCPSLWSIWRNTVCKYGETFHSKPTNILQYENIFWQYCESYRASQEITEKQLKYSTEAVVCISEWQIANSIHEQTKQWADALKTYKLLRSTGPTKDQILNIFLAVQGRDILEVVGDETGWCCMSWNFSMLNHSIQMKKYTHFHCSASST